MGNIVVLKVLKNGPLRLQRNGAKRIEDESALLGLGGEILC